MRRTRLRLACLFTMPTMALSRWTPLRALRLNKYFWSRPICLVSVASARIFRTPSSISCTLLSGRTVAPLCSWCSWSSKRHSKIRQFANSWSTNGFTKVQATCWAAIRSQSIQTSQRRSSLRSSESATKLQARSPQRQPFRQVQAGRPQIHSICESQAGRPRLPPLRRFRLVSNLICLQRLTMQTSARLTISMQMGTLALLRHHPRPRQPRLSSVLPVPPKASPSAAQ